MYKEGVMNEGPVSVVPLLCPACKGRTLRPLVMLSYHPNQGVRESKGGYECSCGKIIDVVSLVNAALVQIKKTELDALRQEIESAP